MNTALGHFENSGLIDRGWLLFTEHAKEASPVQLTSLMGRLTTEAAKRTVIVHGLPSGTDRQVMFLIGHPVFAICASRNNHRKSLIDCDVFFEH